MCVWALPVIIFECLLPVSLITCFPPRSTDWFRSLTPLCACVCVLMCLHTWFCVHVCVTFRFQLPLHEVKLYFKYVFLTLDHLWNHILLVECEGRKSGIIFDPLGLILYLSQQFFEVLYKLIDFTSPGISTVRIWGGGLVICVYVCVFLIHSVFAGIKHEWDQNS